MHQVATRVLVVDDERFFREAIGDVLAAVGIEAHKVSSGEEALKSAEDESFSVVVLDIDLAGMSGLDVLRQLRLSRPALRVIVLSSAVDQEAVLEALRLDAIDYLAKPLHDEELVLVVRRAMASYGVEAGFDRLRRRLQVLRGELAGLADAVRSVEGLSEDELCQRIAQSVSEVLGATKTSVMLLDGDRETLRVRGAVGNDLPLAELSTVSIGDPVAGLAVANGEPVFANDVAVDVRFAGRVPHERYETSSFAISPLDGGGPLLGALCVTDRPAAEPFDEDDIVLLRILALDAAQLLAQLVARGSEAAARELEPEVDDASAREFVETHAAKEGGRGESEIPVLAEQTVSHPGFEVAPPVLEVSDVRAGDAELARAVCEAITAEIEPARLLDASLQPIARNLPAAPVALYLLDPATGDLAIEGQVTGATPGDRPRLSRTRGLTATVLQTGRLVATDHPETDPRFDPEVDTPANDAVGPLLCIPLRLRGKIMGIARVFPAEGASASARTGEVLSAALSAAVRNVLLYRSLLESIDEVAKARQNLGAA